MDIMQRKEKYCDGMPKQLFIEQLKQVDLQWHRMDQSITRQVRRKIDDYYYCTWNKIEQIKKSIH